MVIWMSTIRDRLWTKAAEQRVPLTAAFELLPVCNLSCKMCYVRKSMDEVNAAGGLIRGEQWLQWAKEARGAGMLYPLITGGEPFLHPDFWQIYEGMSEMGMQVSINSNGTLITREIAERLGKNPPTRINITLYGASEESYRNLCGSGEAFYKVREAVKLLKEYNVPIKFNSSITSYNVGDIEELVKYAESVEIPLQIATYMFPPIRRDDTMIGQNDRLSPEESAFARVKSDFLRAEPEWFLGQTERYMRFIPIETVLERIGGNEKMPQKIQCRAGTSSAWLDWRGNMSNCGMYNSATTPLLGKTFAEAWKKVTELTAQFEYSSFCSICPNRRLCHPCVAMVYNECGALDGRPDYMCKMNEAAAKYYCKFAEKHYPEQFEKLRRGGYIASNEAEADDVCGMDDF